jgi:tetratricopeptide (TPR) repeat protein
VLLACAVAGTTLADQTGLREAVSLYEGGKYLQASQAFSRICPASAHCGPARIWLGRSFLKLRRWNDAVDQMEEAVKEGPDSSEAHLWLGRAYGMKAADSFFLTALGLAKKVAREFETAIRLNPENVDARFDLLEFCIEAPSMVGGGKDKALDQAEAIAQLNKRLGYTARAQIAEHDKDWQTSEGELRQAVADFPDDPGAYADLAAFLFRRGGFQGAASVSARALALRPEYPAVQLTLAASEIRQGKKTAEAEEILRGLAVGPLVYGDPSFEEVYYWLGEALLDQGQKAEARRAFQTALEFNPDYKEAKSALAKLRP